MFADVNGTSIYYELHGAADGRVLALCHSLGTSTALWDGQVAAAESTLPGMRILTYDVRGHGRSAVSPVYVSIELLAADFIALLDLLNIDRVDFAGVSLGGIVGQWLGVRAPERIDRLILANTAAKLGALDMWNTRMAMVADRGLAPIVEGAIGRWFTVDFAAREPAAADAFRRILLGTPPSGYIAACAAIRDADLRRLAKQIAVPTLVVAGESDVVTTVDDAAWLAANIPNASMITLPAAHLANVEAASEFNDAISQFLSRPETTRGR
jgi:3-oxoadipate enol-lactonase